jgi:hypothetical protein
MTPAENARALIEVLARDLACAVVEEARIAGVRVNDTNRDLTRQMAAVFADDLAVFVRKQADYGAGNIGAFGLAGVLLRSHDKTQRLANLARSADSASAAIRSAVKGEAVEDTLGDLTNYGAIGRLVTRGLWPEFVEGA